MYREMKSTRIGDTSDVSIDIIHLETIFQINNLRETLLNRDDGKINLKFR